MQMQKSRRALIDVSNDVAKGLNYDGKILKTQSVKENTQFDKLTAEFGSPTEPNMSQQDFADMYREKFPAEYSSLVFSYNTSIQNQGINPTYMKDQSDINVKMRELLLDWLVQVQVKFELTSSTLYLAVQLLDRFLSAMDVSRTKLQLVGCSCLWLASKFEEIYCPEIDDFVHISDSAFLADDLKRTERLIFHCLHYQVFQPTCYAFLRRFQREINASVVLQLVSCMLAELSLLHGEFLQFKSRNVAVGCLFAGLYIIQRNKENLACNYEDELELGRLEDTDRVEKLLLEKYQHQKNSKLKAVLKKYETKEYKQVSLLDI